MLVIGAGRIGGALAARAAERGAACTLITRTDGWDALDRPPGEPVLLTVGVEDLGAAVERVPRHRREDLVLIQNGMIRPWIAANYLTQATRGVLYFGVPARGAPIAEGLDSVFTGVYAVDVVRWLTSIGLGARAVDWSTFSLYELEKLLWICVFGLLCERFGADVGTVVRDHGDAVVGLTDELRKVGRASMGVDVELAWLVGRLRKYSLTIPTWKASVKEWKWRNGWMDVAAATFDVATPLHRDILRAVGKGDLLVPRSDGS
jgi:hypothetical protein